MRKLVRAHKARSAMAALVQEVHEAKDIFFPDAKQSKNEAQWVNAT